MERASTPPGRTLSRRKKVVYALFALLLSLVLVEGGLRILFAFKVGPRVLLYGTSVFRNQAVVQAAPGGLELAGEFNAHRKGDHQAVGNTDQAVGTAAGGYEKYFPNETKFDFDEQGQRFEVSINEHGFRGKGFSVEKRPGVVRVVTLGASSTFGYYDRDDETYPHYLETNLNRDGGGRTFEVLNLGIPHLTSAQILELFRADALPLDPDVVTFYEGLNDSSLMPDAAWQARTEAVAVESPFRRFRRKVADLAFLRTAYSAARDRLLVLTLIDSVLLSNVVTYGHVDVERHISGKSATFLANIAAIRDECRRRGIAFVVMTQQARSMTLTDVAGVTYDDEVRAIREKLAATDRIDHQEKTLLTHKVLMDSLRTWARAEQVPLVDVIPLLDHDRGVLLSWVHLNPRGNRQIAAALATEILSVLGPRR